GSAGLILLAVLLSSVWIGIIAAFVALQCWAGFRVARILAAREQDPSAYLSDESEHLIAACTELPERAPDNVRARVNRGDAYLRQGQYEQALADYAEAIRLDPHDTQAHQGRAEALYDVRDYDGALADCAEVLRLDPEAARAYNLLAWLLA